MTGAGPMSPAPPMSAAMRARRDAWRVAGRLQRWPTVRRVLAGLEPSRSWHGFVPSATSAAAVTVDAAADGAAFEERAVVVLREHGVVVLTGLVSPAEVAAALADAQAMLAPFEAATAGDVPGEGSLDGCRWVVGTKGGAARGKQEATMIRYLGGGDDAGLVGMTRVDEYLRSRGGSALLALIDSAAQQRLAAIVARLHDVRERIFDIQKKPSVAAPQTAHVDTAGSFFYAFQYPNDMREPADGPYAYMPGSHRREDLLARDLVLNRAAGRAPRDLPALADRLVPMMAPAGSIVLSCQRGVHGGLPQPAGRVRWALQTSFV